MIDWIRESNLIEDIDDPEEDRLGEIVWTTLTGHPTEPPCSIETILYIHRQLLWNLNRRIAGRFRTCDVKVGGYTAPSWELVPMLMRAWSFVTDWQSPSTRTIPSVDLATRWHVDFEKIHPFEDGNGRVGRMLMNWQLVRCGFEPLLIKASERQAYYRWFR